MVNALFFGGILIGVVAETLIPGAWGHILGFLFAGAGTGAAQFVYEG